MSVMQLVFWLLASAELSSVSSAVGFVDLQIVVLTIKLPETDLVLVIERAALRNTFDLEKG